MTDKEFWGLYRDALGREEFPGFAAAHPEAGREELARVYAAAHTTVRDMREELGLSQVAFGERFCIPWRTIQSWETGERTPPEWAKLLLLRDLDRKDPLDGL